MASSDIQQPEATLPGGHYLDPGHFERKRESIFHSEWFCAGVHPELCRIVLA